MKNLIVLTMLAAALTTPSYANASDDADSSIALAGPATIAQGPIVLDRAAIQSASGYADDFNYSAIVSLKFTNTYESVATSVTFALRLEDGRVVNIKDVGRFAKGQTTSHTFYGLDVPNRATVEVTEAFFADGSTWTSKELPPPISRRQAALR